MTELLEALHAPLLEEVSGLEHTPEGLRGQLDLRYGLLAFQIDHDDDAEALRVGVRLPPPIGAGHEHHTGHRVLHAPLRGCCPAAQPWR